jgi:hypothetical protein
MFALQQLIAYGLPLITGHEIVREYSDEYVARAGLEVCVFLGCLAGSWRLGMQVFSPSPPVCYALHALARKGLEGLSRTGFYLIIASTGFILLQSVGLTDFVYTLLPAGSSSIVTALLGRSQYLRFFPGLDQHRQNRNPLLEKSGLCWVVERKFPDFLLVVAPVRCRHRHRFGGESAFFGAPVAFPWLCIAIMLLALSFLNLGKYPMRERYWTPERRSRRYGQPWPKCRRAIRNGRRPASTYCLPRPTTEALGQNPRCKPPIVCRSASTIWEICCLSSTRWTSKRIPPLYGETYELIPPLLVPRILWPDKPRTHEGQVLLAVHFGRQELESTFDLYCLGAAA